MILKFEKRSFWEASYKIVSFTIISVPQKSHKWNRKTIKFRKVCGSAIFENWHLLFTLKVVCWWFLKSIMRLLSSFTTQDSLLQPTNTQILQREEMVKPLKEDWRYFRQKSWKGKIIASLVIVLHTWIIDYNKKSAVCFFEIFQTLNFPTQYGFKKNLNSWL